MHGHEFNVMVHAYIKGNLGLWWWGLPIKNEKGKIQIYFYYENHKKRDD